MNSEWKVLVRFESDQHHHPNSIRMLMIKYYRMNYAGINLWRLFIKQKPPFNWFLYWFRWIRISFFRLHKGLFRTVFHLHIHLQRNKWLVLVSQFLFIENGQFRSFCFSATLSHFWLKKNAFKVPFWGPICLRLSSPILLAECVEGCEHIVWVPQLCHSLKCHFSSSTISLFCNNLLFLENIFCLILPNFSNRARDFSIERRTHRSALTVQFLSAVQIKWCVCCFS